MRNRNKQLALNLIASILAFAINTGIQFVITPILSQNIGDEAYGFITIANDFVSYASIFAVVLNSVAARFISVEIHKGNNERAEEYYNSIFFGNVLISIVLAALGAFVVIRFHNFLVISKELITDVSILFAITFGNYILSVLISLFTVSIYVKDRIDLSSIRNIISYIIKLIAVVALFTLATPVKVYYLAIATLISTVFLGFANARISKKIMPEIRIRSHRFRPKLIVELLKTGMWMTINNLSNVIAGNFTTIIINLNIGADVAGFYSVARTIPNAANSFVYAIYSVFVPTYYRLYAKDDTDELIIYSKMSMKIMAFIVAVPVIVLCVKSYEFLSLWQSFRPVNEIKEMSTIFVITLALCICYCSVLSISQLGLVANKIKWQMLNNILISCLTLFATFISIKFTNWGLVGVAVSSLVVQGSKWVFFTPIYAAYVIGAPRFVFFKENVRIIICELCSLAVLIILGKLISCNTWLSLVVVAIVMVLLGYLIMFLLMFNKDEKKLFVNTCKKYLRISR